MSVRGLEAPNQVSRRIVSLNHGGNYQNPKMRRPTSENIEHILDRGARRRSDHGDSARKGGKRAFTLPSKKSFGRKLCFELLKSYLKCPRSHRLNMIDRKL